MGKKKQKNRKRTLSSDGSERVNKNDDPTSNKVKERAATATPPTKIENPLLDQQGQFMRQKGLTDTERFEFFSPSISSDRRAELWMAQADVGEDLVNRYAWATPNSVAIRIIKEFSPLVEIGCGSNAYWCKLLRKSGVDIVGYDVNISSGGLIEGNAKKKDKKNKNKNASSQNPSFLKQGGPDILSTKELKESGRTLFLCYPDEDEDEETAPPMNDRGHDEQEDEPTSMGWQSLHHFSGEHVIHVGETFMDANFSMEQAPWGRSSAAEFQQRLASEYHCLLKVELPNWFHTRDSISVWKRSVTSTIVFAADEEEDESGEEDEEVEYRHIPRNERLPVNIAAPCLEHLLPDNNRGRKDFTPPLQREAPSPSKSQSAKEKPAVSSSQKRSKSTTETDIDTPVQETTGKPEASSSRKKKKKKSNHKEEENITEGIKKMISNAGYDWGELDDAIATDGDGKW